jgi:hypothetical protein
MDNDDLQALELLAQLQRLTTAGDDTAMRLTIRNAKGEWIGDIPLSGRAAAALTEATESTANYADRPAAIDYSPLTGTDGSVSTAEAIAWDSNLHDPGTFPDPLLIAQVEDHFTSLDPLSLLGEVMASDRPDAARAAYEQLITGEWDGS